MKLFFVLSSLIILFSCGQDKSSADATVSKDVPAKKDDSLSITEHSPIHLDYPALYSNWEAGSKESINVILDMYRDWDGTDFADMSHIFADTVVLNLPQGETIKSSKENVLKRLNKYRKDFRETSNNVLSIFPLKNIDTKEEWVNALIYNKWTYQDKKRDSMLYMDLWRVKEGKINYLLSLQHSIYGKQASEYEKKSQELKE